MISALMMCAHLCHPPVPSSAANLYPSSATHLCPAVPPSIA
ncbi:unnamed protein product, partial [Staurois parvus]